MANELKYLSRRKFAGLSLVAASSLALAGCAAAPKSSSDTNTDTDTTDAESVEEAGAADLIVVGAGSGGLAGAAKAAQGGASVIVLEANSMTGGTTALCGGHYKYLDDSTLAMMPERTEESDAELSQFIEQDPEDFGDYKEDFEKLQEEVEEYLASDSTLEFDSLEYWLCLHQYWTRYTDLDGVEATTDHDVCKAAYVGSAEVHDWMVEGGIEFSELQPNNRGEGGPISVEPEGQGGGLISGLQTMAEDAGAEIVLNAQVTSLIMDEDSKKITGVLASVGGKTVRYTANKGVLLASGGFASNAEMVYDNDNCFTGISENQPSCEPATCVGDGIDASQEYGAATANMQFIQYFGFPTAVMGSIETYFPVMSCSKLGVDIEGNRFCNDSMLFFGGAGLSKIKPVCDLPEARFYMIGDAAAQEGNDSYADYVKSGVIVEADTIEDLANTIGVDAEALAATIETFNGYVDAGSDPDFGRDQFAGKVETAPFIAISISMYVQNTMGGICINTDGNVVDTDGNAISNLFAAGEVVGNVDGGLRRHGDNFAHILYYGWLAGKTVAEA